MQLMLLRLKGLIDKWRADEQFFAFSIEKNAADALQTA